LILLIAISALAYASEGPPVVLNAKTYASRSGEFSLEVDPSTMYGQGEAAYRLSRGGKEVWAAKQPFTFWEAVVSDDGTAAGFGYEYGPRGFAPGGRGADRSPGKFYIAVLAPDGKTRRLDAVDRAESRFLHDTPNPLASGVFADAKQRIAVIRLRNPDINKGGERWRIFELPTGDALADIDLPWLGDSGRRVMDVRPVRDTPLVLVHWWHYDEKSPKNPGGAFTLVDLTDPKKPAEVWRQVLPGDYFSGEGNFAVMKRVDEEGVILRCDQPRRFDLHFVAEKKRVTFEVTPGPKGLGGDWATRELAREPYDWPAAAAKAEPASDKLREVPLKSLGEVKLAIPAPRSTQPVRDVYGFDIDDQGRIGFIRGETGNGGGRSFVLVDANGNAVIDAAPMAQGISATKVAWLTGDRWVVADGPPGREKQSRAWFVDVDVSKRRAGFQPIEKFEASSVESLCSTRDGGFAALCNHRYQSTITHELFCYDKAGRRRWMVESNSAKDSILFSPKDIAFDPTGGGSLVVLENIRNTLQILSVHGDRKRTIDLHRSFGKKPNYVTDVAVTSDGALVIHDFHGSPPIWRLRNDGTLIDHFDPRFPDGRRFEVRDIRVGPKDSIWANDGTMIVRLDVKGVVDRALGTPPGANADGPAGAVAFGPAGEIYLASARGAVVRAFDASGKLLRTLKADPGDFASNTDIHRLAVDGGGDVYLAAWDGPYLRLKSDGTRAGWEKEAVDTITETWTFQPGTRKRWVAGYEQICLVDDAGKALREIRRQPDRRWIIHPAAMAVAPDGSLALYADNGMRPSRGSNDEDSSLGRLNFYTPAGEPIRTIRLPFLGWAALMTFDGRRAVIARTDAAGKTELILATVADGSLSRLKLDGAKASLPDGRWQPAFSPDGRDLWLIDLVAKEKSVRRFAIGG
jgi:sugar lactone lactonase YvrE